MEKYYTTGKFAKLAKVTERTIRYYDKINLLKPTMIQENGYRMYSEYDLVRLQRILALRNMGFSLEKIHAIIIQDNKSDINDSISLQLNLVNQKIDQLQKLKSILLLTSKQLHEGQIPWIRILDLIQETNKEDEIAKNYLAATTLEKRRKLHQRYTTNPTNWYQWVATNIDFSKVTKLLEIGCGDGDLWKWITISLRNREITLSDVDQKKLEVARNSLGNEYSYLKMNGEELLFKNQYFDALLANYVLPYTKDVNKVISEVSRVLKKDGLFYATTFGKAHMQEIHDVIKQYDEKIKLKENTGYKAFGIDNGRQILEKYFKDIRYIGYQDVLQITNVDDLLDYIYSCIDDQRSMQRINHRLLKEYLVNKINEDGHIIVTKELGMYICKK